MEKILIIAVNIIFILCFLPALGATVMSPMILATHDGRVNPAVFLVMFLVIVLPVVIAVTQFYSWKYYFSNQLKSSLYYACLPLGWAGALLLVLLVVGLFELFKFKIQL